MDAQIKAFDPSSLQAEDRPASRSDGQREFEGKVRDRIKEGSYDAALALLKERSAQDKTLLTDIGILLLKQGNYDGAIGALEEALEYVGNDFITRKALAFAYYKKDDLERSLKNAEKGLFVKQDPELQALHERITREHRTQRGFINESSAHFKVVFDGYEHGGVSRKVIGILEDAYRSIGTSLGHFPSEPVTVILYTNKDFYDTTQAPGWAGGSHDPYDGKIRLPVKGAEHNEALLKRVLFHEYAHAVVFSLTSSCPLWLNEGIAEYYSGGYDRRSGQVVPLPYLERSFGWLNDRVGVAYLVSYSAVAHLIERYGAYRVKEALLSLSRGNDPNKAFTEAFSITYNDFVAKWGKS